MDTEINILYYLCEYKNIELIYSFLETIPLDHNELFLRTLKKIVMSEDTIDILKFLLENFDNYFDYEDYENIFTEMFCNFVDEDEDKSYNLPLVNYFMNNILYDKVSDKNLVKINSKLCNECRYIESCNMISEILNKFLTHENSYCFHDTFLECIYLEKLELISEFINMIPDIFEKIDNNKILCNSFNAYTIDYVDYIYELLPHVGNINEQLFVDTIKRIIEHRNIDWLIKFFNFYPIESLDYDFTNIIYLPLIKNKFNMFEYLVEYCRIDIYYSDYKLFETSCKYNFDGIKYLFDKYANQDIKSNISKYINIVNKNRRNYKRVVEYLENLA